MQAEVRKTTPDRRGIAGHMFRSTEALPQPTPTLQGSPCMTAATARQEWATMWQLPLVCMLGTSGSAMFAYAGGVYMESVTRAFGWTRAQYSSAFLLMMLSGLVISPAIGWLVDRIGPRRVVLGGIIP